MRATGIGRQVRDVGASETTGLIREQTHQQVDPEAATRRPDLPIRASERSVLAVGEAACARFGQSVRRFGKTVMAWSPVRPKAVTATDRRIGSARESKHLAEAAVRNAR
jgi:hypothetical protein